MGTHRDVGTPAAACLPRRTAETRRHPAGDRPDASSERVVDTLFPRVPSAGYPFQAIGVPHRLVTYGQIARERAVTVQKCRSGGHLAALLERFRGLLRRSRVVIRAVSRAVTKSVNVKPLAFNVLCPMISVAPSG